MSSMRNFHVIGLMSLELMCNAQRIAVLSDIHVSPGNDNAHYLAMAVEEINNEAYDLVVVDGDLTNEGADRELRYVKDLLDKVIHPLYVIPGNHENNWSQSATRTFNDLWGTDRFVTDIGDLVLVGINCGPYMKMGDGHVKQEDLHWLRHTLDSLVTEGKRVVSFNHYPIRKDDLDNYREYVSLLQSYPVAVHINGHYHRPDKYSTGGIDAVTVRALTLDDTHGYSVLQIDGDNITVSDKVIGGQLTTLYDWTIDTGHYTHLADTPCPWTTPQGYEVTKVHTDSASVFTRLAFDADNVYFGNSLGEAKAVNKDSGQLAWSVPLGSALFAKPVVLEGGRVAFPHNTGIRVMDAVQGTTVVDYGSKDGPYVADGLMAGDSIYVQGGYKRFERRSPYNGHLIWSYDSIDNYCQGAPVIDGDDLIFGAWDTYLRCLNPTTGQLKWQWSNGRTNNLYSPGNVVPAITDSRVIIVAPDRQMTSIDRTSGLTIWRNGSHKFRESMGMSADRTRVYAKTMDGELVAVDANADVYTELWLCDLGIGYDHAPCVIAEVDGVIYVGSRRGILTAVSAVTHDVLWQLELGSSEINGIDIDPTDRTVWLSLIEGTIYQVKHKG